MAQIPHADKGLTCPLHKQPMEKVCHKCPLWMNVRGLNPQTGDPVDQWNCSLAWLPMLLIENAQQSRQTGAAVESFRNEMIKANAVSLGLQFPQLLNGKSPHA